MFYNLLNRKNDREGRLYRLKKKEMNNFITARCKKSIIEEFGLESWENMDDEERNKCIRCYKLGIIDTMSTIKQKEKNYI